MFKIALIANKVQIKWQREISALGDEKKSNKMPPFPTTSCTSVSEISIDEIAQRAPALSNAAAF